MIDLYLKFPDLATTLTVLADYTYPDEGGAVRLGQGEHQWALCEVGELPGYDGYHVNFRALDPELDLSALEPYRVYPQTPSVVWA